MKNIKTTPCAFARTACFLLPSNQQYNRCLKEMGKEIGFKILTEKGRGTHRMRYFMVNEVLYNNGVPLKTTGKIAGQKSIRTTEKYVRPNKKQISANMKMVKKKLFDEQGGADYRGHFRQRKEQRAELSEGRACKTIINNCFLYFENFPPLKIRFMSTSTKRQGYRSPTNEEV